MKKRILLLIIGSSIFLIKPLQSNNDNPITIERPTHLVFRRYYFIARLEKTIKLIKEIVSNAPRDEIRKIANCSEMPIFSHKLVLQAAYRIQQAKSLKPIFVVWDDFSAYKSLEAEVVIGKDDLFIKEFGQQLFFIAKNILSITKPIVYKTIPYDLNAIVSDSPEEILNALDYLIELIQSDSPKALSSHKKMHHDIKIHASSDEINVRFYHLKRLLPIVELIHTIDQIKSPVHKSVYRTKNNEIQHINATWNQIRQYRRIGDKDYIQNFCILLFNVLKSIHQHDPSEATHDGFFGDVEIEDILYSLDVIADELNAVVQEYNQQEKASFREWITTYWWIPLSTLSSIALKILHHHYTTQK